MNLQKATQIKHKFPSNNYLKCSFSVFSRWIWLKSDFKMKPGTATLCDNNFVHEICSRITFLLCVCGKDARTHFLPFPQTASTVIICFYYHLDGYIHECELKRIKMPGYSIIWLSCNMCLYSVRRDFLSCVVLTQKKIPTLKPIFIRQCGGPGCVCAKQGKTENQSQSTWKTLTRSLRRIKNIYFLIEWHFFHIRSSPNAVDSIKKHNNTSRIASLFVCSIFCVNVR